MKQLTLLLLFCGLHATAIAQTNGYIFAEADSTLPSVQAELHRIRLAMSQSIPVRLLDGLDPEARFAQEIALNDLRFTRNLIEPGLNEKVRNEVFSVAPVRIADLTPQLKAVCTANNCYRVELFNYAINLLSVAVVDTRTSQVVALNEYQSTQPELPSRLRTLAMQLAAESPAVHKALGYRPDTAQAQMAATKTSLNRSRCERSQHLCVAPTFVKGDKAIWAIVDLTDLRVVGVRWTNVGNPGALPDSIFTERKLQNGSVMEQYCNTENHLSSHDWTMNYTLTSSDGLMISDITFGGIPVVESIKLVDWHVSYSNTDGFGYSDAVGCPCFSTSAVVAIEPPKVLSIVENGAEVGFALQQNYYSEGWPLACNYNYCQRLECYTDGRFRVAVASLGRGCGNDGTYRPVTRIAFAGDKQQFSEWKNTDWQTWQTEQWTSQTPLTRYTPEGYLAKIATQNGGFFIAPSVGQFADGGRGDNAFVYITRHRTDRDEGDTDLPTIGPCCNTDYHQGPEKFIEPSPESLSDVKLVMWYVAQIKNDDTPGHEYCWAENTIKNGVYSPRVFPCFSGPMFVPIVSKKTK